MPEEQLPSPSGVDVGGLVIRPPKRASHRAHIRRPAHPRWRREDELEDILQFLPQPQSRAENAEIAVAAFSRLCRPVPDSFPLALSIRRHPLEIPRRYVTPRRRVNAGRIKRTLTDGPTHALDCFEYKLTGSRST